MSCVSALHSQIATLFSVPQEVLLLRHKVLREYAKIAIGPDFVHTLPTVVIMVAAALVLWKYPPFPTRFLDLLGITFVYRVLQVLVGYLVINVLLWLWLILQRILYCSVGDYWGYESDYRDVLYPWWQHIWSSYYPPRMQPLTISASFISWIVAMLVAVFALGCAVFINRIAVFVEGRLPKVRYVLAIVAMYCMSWPWKRIWETIVSFEASQDDGEVSLVDYDSHSEISNDANSAARGDTHLNSYERNWMPQVNFSMFKGGRRKLSVKSFHTTAGVNNVQDPDMAKQMRYCRSCHTVMPGNSNERSSEC